MDSAQRMSGTAEPARLTARREQQGLVLEKGPVRELDLSPSAIDGRCPHTHADLDPALLEVGCSPER